MALDTFSQRAIHISKKDQVTSKGDDPYQVLERINNNAYKIDLLREFSVRSIFDVNDLTPFNVGDNFPDSRTNHFEEYVYSMNMEHYILLF